MLSDQKLNPTRHICGFLGDPQQGPMAYMLPAMDNELLNWYVEISTTPSPL